MSYSIAFFTGSSQTRAAMLVRGIYDNLSILSTKGALCKYAN